MFWIIYDTLFASWCAGWLVYYLVTDQNLGFIIFFAVLSVAFVGLQAWQLQSLLKNARLRGMTEGRYVHE